MPGLLLDKEIKERILNKDLCVIHYSSMSAVKFNTWLRNYVSLSLKNAATYSCLNLDTGLFPVKNALNSNNIP